MAQGGASKAQGTPRSYGSLLTPQVRSAFKKWSSDAKNLSRRFHALQRTGLLVRHAIELWGYGKSKITPNPLPLPLTPRSLACHCR